MPQHKRAVVAVNSDGSMAGYFESMYDLCHKYHLTKHHVSVSCQTGKLYRGLRWMYDADYKQLWLEGRTHELAYERPEGQKPMQRGDKAGKPLADSTALTYVCGLIRRFGENATLREIKEKLNIKERKDDIEEIYNQGTETPRT